MQKECKCGNTMNIRLRTVIYSNKVEIENVPIYTCDICSSSEIFSGIKDDLTGLIDKLGEQPHKQLLLFEDVNEFAHLMYKVSDKDQLERPIEEIIEDRINQLLDLLLLAQSVNDSAWMEDIQSRLFQITKQTLSTYDFS
jgi:hypothetical protein